MIKFIDKRFIDNTIVFLIADEDECIVYDTTGYVHYYTDLLEAEKAFEKRCNCLEEIEKEKENETN